MNAAPLCFVNVSKEFSAKNTKKPGLYGFSHDFTVDYDSIDATTIVLICLYLRYL